MNRKSGIVIGALLPVIKNTISLAITEATKLTDEETLPAIQSNYTWLLLSVTTSICTLGP